MQRIFSVLLAIAIGGLGGLVASVLGLPLPFLIGSFVFSIIAVVARFQLAGLAPTLPMGFRNIFVAVIGVMIGGAFSPGLMADILGLWLPAIAMVGFVFLALAVNFQIFLRIGKFDKVTAFYAAMPGGLIESIAIGEGAGADVQKLSLQQFLRIALVITIVPSLFQIGLGVPVGSAAGMRLDVPGQPILALDVAILVFCSIAGLYLGKLMRLPAGILTGPLILSAIAHGSGMTEAAFPPWFIAFAQVVVGAGLGMRFQGFRIAQIFNSIGLSLISVAAMLFLSGLFAFVLSEIVPIPFQVLFIAFAPGGVTETALIALSLSASPVLVTTMHIFRITVTVGLITFGAGRWTGEKKGSDSS